MLITETHVPDAALPVAALKAHLRMGTGFGDDTLQDAVLGSFLRAAMAAIEAGTGKVLLEREFTLAVSSLRNASALPLTVAPVTVIADVQLIMRSGIETTVHSSVYWLERDAQTPRLRAAAACLPGPARGGELLRVVKDGVILREETLSAPTFSYGFAAQTADGAVAPFVVEVAQISATYGAGLFASTVIT